MTRYFSPKAELVYLWIRNYKNIKEQGFHLVGDLRFTFDLPNNELIIEDQDYPQLSECDPPFWGDKITSLTSIVGENGSGKSNFLEFLCKVLNRYKTNENDVEIDFILVKRLLSYGEERKTKSTITISSNWNGDLKITNQSKAKLTDLNDPGFLSNNVNYVIYQTTMLDIRKERISLFGDYSADISTRNLIKGDSEKLKGLFPIEAFRLNSFQRQVELLAYDKIKDFSLIFDDFIPSNVEISILDVLTRSTNTQSGRKDVPKNDFNIYFKDLAQACNFFFGIQDDINKSPWNAAIDNMNKNFFRTANNLEKVQIAKDLKKHRFLQLLVKGLIRNLDELSGSNQNGYDTVLGENFALILQTDLNWVNPDSILKSFNEDWFKLLSGYNSKAEEFIRWLSEKVFAKIDSLGETATIQVDPRVTFSREEGEEIFRRYLIFINEYGTIGKNQLHPRINFLQFEFRDLSTGEYVFLDIFARIHSVFSKLEELIYQESDFNSNLHIFLLIDEGEIGLHPEWQRRFINRVVKFINSYQNNLLLFHSLQIIFTTHSPLILSDFPKQQVIFIERDKYGFCDVNENKESFFSFGANLNSILSQSFFLREGFMGEFAHDKISDSLSWLSLVDKKNQFLKEKSNSKKIELEEIEKEINLHPFSKIDSIKRDEYLKKVMIRLIDEPLIEYKYKELLSLYENSK